MAIPLRTDFDANTVRAAARARSTAISFRFVRWCAPSRRQSRFSICNQGLISRMSMQGREVTVVLDPGDDGEVGYLASGFEEIERPVRFAHLRQAASKVVVSDRIIRRDDERTRNPLLRSFFLSELHEHADAEGQRERVFRVQRDFSFDPLQRPACGIPGFAVTAERAVGLSRKTQ